ncbi:hypothetical protein J6590_076451 [Homalodisca vitripennis]|nr:hypothetical protein J6590_076451 [Homalodisca vitripennis]
MVQQCMRKWGGGNTKPGYDKAAGHFLLKFIETEFLSKTLKNVASLVPSLCTGTAVVPALVWDNSLKQYKRGRSEKQIRANNSLSAITPALPDRRRCPLTGPGCNDAVRQICLRSRCSAYSGCPTLSGQSRCCRSPVSWKLLNLRSERFGDSGDNILMSFQRPTGRRPGYLAPFKTRFYAPLVTRLYVSFAAKTQALKIFGVYVSVLGLQHGTRVVTVNYLRYKCLSVCSNDENYWIYDIKSETP